MQRRRLPREEEPLDEVSVVTGEASTTNHCFYVLSVCGRLRLGHDASLLEHKARDEQGAHSEGMRGFAARREEPFCERMGPPPKLKKVETSAEKSPIVRELATCGSLLFFCPNPERSRTSIFCLQGLLFFFILSPIWDTMLTISAIPNLRMMILLSFRTTSEHEAFYSFPPSILSSGRVDVFPHHLLDNTFNFFCKPNPSRTVFSASMLH